MRCYSITERRCCLIHFAFSLHPQNMQQSTHKKMGFPNALLSSFSLCTSKSTSMNSTTERKAIPKALIINPRYTIGRDEMVIFLIILAISYITQTVATKDRFYQTIFLTRSANHASMKPKIPLDLSICLSNNGLVWEHHDHSIPLPQPTNLGQYPGHLARITSNNQPRGLAERGYKMG